MKHTDKELKDQNYFIRKKSLSLEFGKFEQINYSLSEIKNGCSNLKKKKK